MTAAPPTHDDLRREVASIRWFHQIDLGGGIVTPGHDNSAEKLPRIGLPEDLRGKSVLDIGSWDGFFSFESSLRKVTFFSSLRTQKYSRQPLKAQHTFQPQAR